MVDLRQNAEPRSILERQHVDSVMEPLQRLMLPHPCGVSRTEVMAASL